MQSNYWVWQIRKIKGNTLVSISAEGRKSAVTEKERWSLKEGRPVSRWEKQGLLQNIYDKENDCNIKLICYELYLHECEFSAGVILLTDRCLWPLTTQQAKLVRAMNMGRANFEWSARKQSSKSSHVVYAVLQLWEFAYMICKLWYSYPALDISTMKERKVIFDRWLLSVTSSGLWYRELSSTCRRNILPISSG
jgi:hypothetical protein